MAKWQKLYEKYNPMRAHKPSSIANIAFETGVIAERERIIKLLQETVNVYLTDKLLVEAAIVANNIALIKEKNK